MITVKQVQFNRDETLDFSSLVAIRPQLVLVFGAVDLLDNPNLLLRLNEDLPKVALAGCSTAGEISDRGVMDGSVVITALAFEQTTVKVAEVEVPTMDGSLAAGEALGRQLADPSLEGVLIFSKGLALNGSALAVGISNAIGQHVPVSGGLAGDGGAFKRTLVLSKSGTSEHRVVAVGLYGKALRIAHGSFGGWKPFGPPRRVTRCDGNVLYELDGRSALELYKTYLGEYAKGLPASGLLFPMEMLDANNAPVGLIRTILGVDDTSGSITLAGEIDPNGYLRLMHASQDDLVNGAEIAANRLLKALTRHTGRALSLLVSCVGRKLVMGDAVDEEVEAVATTLGQGITVAGFYSYGEIAPFLENGSICLHNQTMTVTYISES